MARLLKGAKPVSSATLIITALFRRFSTPVQCVILLSAVQLSIVLLGAFLLIAILIMPLTFC